MRFPKAYYETKQAPVKEVHPIIEAEFANGTPTDQTTPSVNVSENPAILKSLDWETWLPFAAKTYHISPNKEDYLIKPMVLMPSDTPNRNGVAFPIEELVMFQPPPMNRQVYKSWVGCPIHIEHDNEDHTKAIGVVLDTALTRIKGYGEGKHWKVMGLLAIDKTKNPDMAQKIATGAIDTGSMGCMADNFTCSVCGAPATENRFTNCPHIVSTQMVNWKIVDYMGEKKIAYLNAHGLSPIEFSVVSDPAWVAALSTEKLDW